ncbi:MAG: hypothetical protein ACW98W_06700 [Candidatus Hodarchaeales archaeon]|jgi:hypothetical protein
MPETEAIFLLGIGGFSFLANLAKSSPYIPDEDKFSLEFVIKGEIQLFKQILALSDEYKKPILITTLIQPEDSPAVAYLQKEKYPIFSSPGNMVQVFRYMVDHYSWKQRI